MGGLAWTVYKSYWKAVGGCMAVCVLLSLLFMQGMNDGEQHFSISLDCAVITPVISTNTLMTLPLPQALRMCLIGGFLTGSPT